MVVHSGSLNWKENTAKIRSGNGRVEEKCRGKVCRISGAGKCLLEVHTCVPLLFTKRVMAPEFGLEFVIQVVLLCALNCCG